MDYLRILYENHHRPPGIARKAIYSNLKDSIEAKWQAALSGLSFSPCGRTGVFIGWTGGALIWPAHISFNRMSG